MVTFGLAERASARARDRRPQGTATPLGSTQRQWRTSAWTGDRRPRGTATPTDSSQWQWPAGRRDTPLYGLGIDNHEGPLPPQAPYSGSDSIPPGSKTSRARHRAGWGSTTTQDRYPPRLHLMAVAAPSPASGRGPPHPELVARSRGTPAHWVGEAHLRVRRGGACVLGRGRGAWGPW